MYPDPVDALSLPRTPYHARATLGSDGDNENDLNEDGPAIYNEHALAALQDRLRVEADTVTDDIYTIDDKVDFCTNMHETTIDAEAPRLVIDQEIPQGKVTLPDGRIITRLTSHGIAPAAVLSLPTVDFVKFLSRINEVKIDHRRGDGRLENLITCGAQQGNSRDEPTAFVLRCKHAALGCTHTSICDGASVILEAHEANCTLEAIESYRKALEESSDQGGIRCPISGCYKDFQTRESRREHMKELHPLMPVPPQLCDRNCCDTVFTTLHGLDIHMRYRCTKQLQPGPSKRARCPVQGCKNTSDMVDGNLKRHLATTHKWTKEAIADAFPRTRKQYKENYVPRSCPVKSCTADRAKPYVYRTRGSFRGHVSSQHGWDDAAMDELMGGLEHAPTADPTPTDPTPVDATTVDATCTDATPTDATPTADNDHDETAPVQNVLYTCTLPESCTTPVATYNSTRSVLRHMRTFHSLSAMAAGLL